MLRADRRTHARNAVKLRLQPLEARTNPSHMFTVDDDRMQRPNADFTSIQAAVQAASAGDEIRVYRGTYNEQVVIPASKDGLKLTAVSGWNDDHDHNHPSGLAVIAPTAFTDPSQAVVRVAGAHNVQIRGFEITGKSAPTGTGAGADYGILVDSGGSASITGNHITGIRDNPLSGVQEGIGIQFGRTDSKGGILSSGSGSATDNTIDDYQKGGIVVIGAGSNATIRKNRIVGAGPTAVIAQNGIQISNGAKATVEQNIVSRNNYTGTDVVAEGILVYQTSGVTVRHNILFGNNEGILLASSKNSVVDHNDSFSNTYNGIGLFDSSNNVVTHNDVFHNGHDGINVDSSTNNRIEDNLAFDNVRYGIAIEANSTGNTVRHNHLYNNHVMNLFVGNPANTVIGNNNRHDHDGDHSNDDSDDDNGHGHGNSHGNGHENGHGRGHDDD